MYSYQSSMTRRTIGWAKTRLRNWSDAEGTGSLRIRNAN